MKFLLIISFLVLIYGCYSQPIFLKHPTTGEVTKCGPYGMQDHTELARENRCIDDYKSRGFQRIRTPESEY